MRMEVLERGDSNVWIRLEGRLDLKGIEDIELAFTVRADRSEKPFLVDLAALTFVGSRNLLAARPDEASDSGVPFDPTGVPPPPPPSLDAAPGGRGLHLVRSLSSSFAWRRDGSRNVVVVEFPIR